MTTDPTTAQLYGLRYGMGLSNQTDDPYAVFANNYNQGCCCAVYIVIIFCSLRIWLHLQSSFKGAEFATARKFNQYVWRALIAQVHHLHSHNAHCECCN